VTHDQIEAMTMGHRIAVMKEGKLQQLGTPLEVYERPANVFVAQFIGSPPMSFVTAMLSANGESIEGEGFKLPVPQSLRPVTAGKAGRKLKVGIRPDNIVAPSATARGQTAPLEVKVDLVEPLGNEVIVHSHLAENSIVFRLPPQHTPETGAKMQVSVELDALHLFDAETEQRLSA
jgi:multiple sugar transport system ATP-binding protein